MSVAFNMSSVYFVVPAFKMQILRDFSKLEKRIAFVVKDTVEKEVSKLQISYTVYI